MIFVECPQAPYFLCRFSVQNGAIPAVLEAVPQCVVGPCRDVSGPTDKKSGFISSSTFHYWCFLEREVEAATPYHPEHT